MASTRSRLATIISPLFYSNNCRSSVLRRGNYYTQYLINSSSSRTYCSQEEVADSPTVSPAIEKAATEQVESFEEMLRNSALVKMGRPQGKRVIGEIFYINGDDLYVDFGWKFHGVVKKPVITQYGEKQESDFKEGSMVEVEINELEQTGHFLGQHRRLTLCEADIKLVAKTPQHIDLSKRRKEMERDTKEKEQAGSDLLDLLLS